MGDDGGRVLIFGAMFGLVFFAGLCFGLVAGRNNAQSEAIAAGVGRFTVDGETGERAFVYGEAGK